MKGIDGGMGGIKVEWREERIIVVIMKYWKGVGFHFESIFPKRKVLHSIWNSSLLDDMYMVLAHCSYNFKTVIICSNRCSRNCEGHRNTRRPSRPTSTTTFESSNNSSKRTSLWGGGWPSWNNKTNHCAKRWSGSSRRDNFRKESCKIRVRREWRKSRGRCKRWLSCWKPSIVDRSKPSLTNLTISSNQSNCS